MLRENGELKIDNADNGYRKVISQNIIVIYILETTVLMFCVLSCHFLISFYLDLILEFIINYHYYLPITCDLLFIYIIYNFFVSV